MAVIVNSANRFCSLPGNGGGFINLYKFDVSFGAGDQALTEAAILAAIPGTGTVLDVADMGNVAFVENSGGGDGCVPFYDVANSELQFINSVDGVKNTAIQAATNAIFTITVQQ